MPGMYGNNVAKTVTNGIARVGLAAWTKLVANAITASSPAPLSGRAWIEIQVRGRNALAITYTNINADGTFTAPAYSAQGAKIIPANSIKAEPLSDKVMMWGRCVTKAGSTDGGLKVVVTEYA